MRKCPSGDDSRYDFCFNNSGSSKSTSDEANFTWSQGSSHLVPDALSRMYESLVPEEIHLIKDPIPSWYTRRFMAVSQFPERFPTWKISDNRLYHYKPDGLVTHFVNDLNEWKLVPNDSERKSVLVEAHDDPQLGHIGTRKTYMRVSRK